MLNPKTINSKKINSKFDESIKLSSTFAYVNNRLPILLLLDVVILNCVKQQYSASS